MVEKVVVIRHAACRFSGWGSEEALAKLDILVGFRGGEDARVVIEERVGRAFQEDPTAHHPNHMQQPQAAKRENTCNITMFLFTGAAVAQTPTEM